MFIDNFTDALSSMIAITEENKKFIESGYEARTEKELAVLTRWINKERMEKEGGIQVPKAKYLDVILYSYQQIQEENKAMGQEDPNKDIAYDYGIISVKPQDVDHELPMNPITMMRNSLGKEYGGSGVPLDASKYKASVEFWNNHALIR